MTDDVLFLSGEQVARLLDADTATTPHRAAFTALGSGAADLPAKTMHPSRVDDSTVLASASRLPAGSGAAAKSGSDDPADAAPGRPTVHAVVTALPPKTGCTWARARVPEPGMRRSAAVVLDGPATAARHAGPIMDALAGARPPLLVDPGDVLTGRAGGGTAPGDIITCAGIGIPHAVAASVVVRVAPGESV
ncbi:hypothetical protein ACFUIY_08805 [Streptomyces griseorubiginosus]|uniref:hypothetical protein n=1 Tax=Streptomyces griseorubiginosus TaxID=67304 RepID=UPI00363028DE